MWRRLLRVELVTIGLLIACATAFIVITGAIGTAMFPGQLRVEGAVLFFGVFLTAGILPATLFFAPIYAILNVPGNRDLLLAGFVGAIPGVVMALMHPEFPYPGYLGVIAGTLVAIGTHYVMTRWR